MKWLWCCFQNEPQCNTIPGSFLPNLVKTHAETYQFSCQQESCHKQTHTETQSLSEYHTLQNNCKVTNEKNALPHSHTSSASSSVGDRSKRAQEHIHNIDQLVPCGALVTLQTLYTHHQKSPGKLDSLWQNIL